MGRLIDLLDSDDLSPRDAAHSALKRITQNHFRSGSKRWRSWYITEIKWWEETAPELIEQLTSADAAEVIFAIGQILPHQLFRHELVFYLLPLLDAGTQFRVTHLRECCSGAYRIGGNATGCGRF